MHLSLPSVVKVKTCAAVTSTTGFTPVLAFLEDGLPEGGLLRQISYMLVLPQGSQGGWCLHTQPLIQALNWGEIRPGPKPGESIFLCAHVRQLLENEGKRKEGLP